MKWQIVVNDNPVEIDADNLSAVSQVEPGV